MTGLAGAGRKTRVRHLLVLDDEVGQHALVGGNLAHGVEVNLAELLDVERPTILVGLVVVLRVVGEDLGLLLVVEVGNQVVEAAAEGSAPFLAVDEPASILVSADHACVRLRFPCCERFPRPVFLSSHRLVVIIQYIHPLPSTSP